MKKLTRNRFSNVIGFDDAPFSRNHQGKVNVVGAVYANLRFDGVIIGGVEKDGNDGAEVLSTLINQSKFKEHAQLIMLQGITLGGFNVVDVFALHKSISLPILVVARRQPDFTGIKQALHDHIQDGMTKWRTMEKLRPMEPAGAVYIQRVGISFHQAESTIRHFSVHSHIPEPLRTAHLIAGALSNGESRGDP